MFFVLSKVLWLAAAPANLLLILAIAGAGACRLGARRWGARLLALGLAGLLIGGVSPLGRLLLRPLEDRFPPFVAPGDAPDGIIVLGGAIDQVVSAARGRIAIVDAAPRLTEAVALARRYPQARLVYTGGSAALVAEIGGEAAEARTLWIDLGIDPSRIAIEDRSRNTAENAAFTRALLDPRPGQRWILVTSAYHMPRSVGLFRSAGFQVIPDPVDYRSTGTWRDYGPHRDVGVGLVALDMAVREWIGLVAYRVAGKIPSLLPGPDASEDQRP